MSNKLESIYNFLQISNLIATSGQPTEQQFCAIENSGYQVVINLALISSSRALSDEKQIVDSLGIEQDLRTDNVNTVIATVGSNPKALKIGS